MRIRPAPVAPVAVIVLIALLAPWLPLPDTMSRMLLGARTSLSVAIAAAGLASLVGIPLGLMNVILPAKARPVVSFGSDVVVCFPPLLLALLFIALRGPGTVTLIAVLAVPFVPGFARAVRAGWRHVLLRLSFALAPIVTLESGLSFLGVGVVPPTSSWGQMISAARATMDQAPLSLLWPAAALCLTIAALHALHAALRGAVNPRGLFGPVRRPVALPPPASRPATGTAVLDVRNLTIEIDTQRGTIAPVRDASFSVRAGETVAVVGERGSGKSLTALALMGLLPDGARVIRGSAWLQGHNLLRLDDAAFRRVRGGVLSMIFQDPRSSLNPVHRIGAQIAEAMHAHFDVADYEAREEAKALLTHVGIPDPKRCARAYPHELTLEVQQRAMIAMAIANDPRLLIADEPTSALDSGVDEQVLDLLAKLRRELGMGLVIMSQSLSSIARIADRVLVLRDGRLVEQGLVREAPRNEPREVA